MTEQEQFKRLPLGDVWEDARLFEAVAYLMSSSKCRCGPHDLLAVRQDPERVEGYDGQLLEGATG